MLKITVDIVDFFSRDQHIATCYGRVSSTCIEPKRTTMFRFIFANIEMVFHVAD